MFIQNKYTKWYFNIIETAKMRESTILITEKHHIIPKALGGSNDSKNMVHLTPREHFIVHSLLPKMLTEDNHKIKMVYAFLKMARSNSTYNRIGNGKLYEKLKQTYKKFYTGINHPSYGKTRSEETKNKISKAHKGKIISIETREKMSKKMLGRKQSLQTIEKRTNTVSKIWIITTPTGSTFTTKNLNKYCFENGLNRGHMSSVANGKRPHHKGYKVLQA